jgi:hypothetical protein
MYFFLPCLLLLTFSYFLLGWGCVVLIDEAEVFLEERGVDNLCVARRLYS